MLKLIYLLEAIRIYAKDCHYNMSGINYLQWHQFMDTVAGPIDDFLDEIKECVFLFSAVDVPRGTEINEQAAQFVPKELGSNESMLSNLRALLSMTVAHINDTKPDETGTGDILSRIGVHLQKMIGLINLAIKEAKDGKASDSEN